MKFSPPPKRKCSERGAALVVTLIVCTVLAMVVVAMMQNTGLDRASSRSIANQYRAKLAAESGLADFQAMLANVVATNDFAVVTLTNGTTNITALVQPQTNGQVRVYPMFSRTNGTNVINASPPFNSTQLLAAANSVGAISNLNPTFVRYGGADWPSTNADSLVLGGQFVTSATNTNGAPVAQFAYVVADDCAKLNLAVAGTNYNNSGRTNPLLSGFAAEIAVFGVGANTLSSEDFNRYKTLPDGVRSGIFLPSVFASTNDRKNKARFYTTHQGSLFDLIPAGYFDDARTIFTAYADAGKFKYDINSLATNSANSTSNAFAIADVIASNLPSFRLRDPSFQNDTKKPSDLTLRYNRRIAASIVDYIDVNPRLTTITDGEPAGKEPLAYPFQIAERYDWVSTEPGSSATSWKVTVQHTVFVELWNPYTVPVSGDFKLEFETFRQIEPTGGSFAAIPIVSGNVPVSLQPNEIKVYRLGTQSIQFSVTGPNPSSNPSATPLTLRQTASEDISKPKHSRFQAFWNNELYDRTASYDAVLFDERGPGLEKVERAMTDANRTDRPVWSANTAQTVRLSTGIHRSVGDPRQNFISNYVWSDTSYTNANTRWNGANNWPANAPATHRFDTTWAARDGLRATLNIGGTAAANADPTSVATTYNAATDANNAPAFVRNGPMDTIAELGHIYDPVHLDDAGASVSGGNPGSFYSAGGGRTLRIGQPELTNSSYNTTLNASGQRAMNLLDIFTARPTGQATNAPRLAGLNVNTAPVDVLAAFFFNLQPVSDQGIAGGSRISLAGATNIANAVVTNRPYFSASDMHRFLNELANRRTNFSPAIAAQAGMGFSPTPNMHDRAREELFRRAYNSLDTKSGAFRFYGVGRALAPSTNSAVPGQVLSTVALEAWIELRAATNAVGQVFLRPIVVQTKFL